MKQVILVRMDLKLSKGKLAAQVAHAAVEAVLKSSPNKVKEWRKIGEKKVILKVADLKELHKYTQRAKDDGLTTAIINDAGRTELAPGTTTVAAIGPDEEELIDQVTGDLKML